MQAHIPPTMSKAMAGIVPNSTDLLEILCSSFDINFMHFILWNSWRNDMIRYKMCSVLSFMWQDEHNSCPICRHELQTDDHAYESWKEREKEAEEERKGAENAIRGGEYMYV